VKKLRFGIKEYDALCFIDQVGNALTRFGEPICRNLGLTVMQYRVLFIIRHINRPIMISDLAQLTDRRINSITTIIDRMERQGLVEKLRDERDRRAINLAITEKGNKKFEAVTGPFMGLLLQLMSCLSEEELQLFIKLIDKLRDRVIEMTAPGDTIEEVYAEDISNPPRSVNKRVA